MVRAFGLRPALTNNDFHHDAPLMSAFDPATIQDVAAGRHSSERRMLLHIRNIDGGDGKAILADDCKIVGSAGGDK
jgi:hypothetical protein